MKNNKRSGFCIANPKDTIDVCLRTVMTTIVVVATLVGISMCVGALILLFLVLLSA